MLSCLCLKLLFNQAVLSGESIFFMMTSWEESGKFSFLVALLRLAARSSSLFLCSFKIILCIGLLQRDLSKEQNKKWSISFSYRDLNMIITKFYKRFS